jgi:gamma-glutamylcyclotransferase (GGCT)/AIG2-like uncharacterized protein YtfP
MIMLFAYGTLQDPDILAAVLGRRVLADAIKLAHAPGFGVVYYPGQVYPALVAVPDTTAPGLLVMDLDALDLAVLDAFEGDEYRRQAIGVQLAGTMVRADTYMPVAAISADSPKWSLAHWTMAHKPAVLAGEARTAEALRQRLTDRSQP